jgi:hypothetical protein
MFTFPQDPFEQTRSIEKALERAVRPRGPLADSAALAEAASDFGRRLRHTATDDLCAAVEGLTTTTNPAAGLTRQIADAIAAKPLGSVAVALEPIAVAGLAASLGSATGSILDLTRGWPGQ